MENFVDITVCTATAALCCIALRRSVSPDDATFVSLARLYADRHANMHRGSGLCEADNFPGGWAMHYSHKKIVTLKKSK